MPRNDYFESRVQRVASGHVATSPRRRRPFCAKRRRRRCIIKMQSNVRMWRQQRLQAPIFECARVFVRIVCAPPKRRRTLSDLREPHRRAPQPE